MRNSLYRYTKKQIKQAFPGYKKIQVGATIKEVVATRTERVGRQIGFQIFEDKRTIYETLPLIKFKRVCIHNRLLYQDQEIHQIYVAVDQQKKTVYWNFELIKD